MSAVCATSVRTKATPVLVIRAPVQPPLSQDDWEPPSAFGVQSPDGFKSELSISQLRPYTPSPQVSTIAGSDTSSSVATPRGIPPRSQVADVLQKATQALALHAQQSLDSLSSESVYSESVYSDPGVAPESLFDEPVGPETVEPEAVEEVEEVAEEVDEQVVEEVTEEVVDEVVGDAIDSESVELGDEQLALAEPEPTLDPEEHTEIANIPDDSQSIVTNPAFESLQVARPLSPVAVALSSSSSSHSQPIIRSSLLGFFSRWADKRSPSLKDKERPASAAEPSGSAPPPSAHRHDSTTSAPAGHLLSSFTNNRSTDLLSTNHEPVKSSAASIKSSVFKKPSFGGLKLSANRKNSGPVPPLPPLPSPGDNPEVRVTPPPSGTRTVLVADTDLPPEAQSVRSGKRRRRILESQSSGATSQSKPARQSVEEPIGGEPVLISAQLQPQSERGDTILSLPHPETRNLPTPPRSRSPSIFRQKLGARSFRELVRRSGQSKQRPANSPAFLSWFASYTHRSHTQNPTENENETRQILPTPSATPDPLPPTPSDAASPTSPERVLSLVWYPPELIKSPYASNTSVDRIRAPHPTPATFEEFERNLSPPPTSVRTASSTPQPSSRSYLNPFYTLDPYPGKGPNETRSSSTIHAPSTSSSRRTPAKLKRRRRPTKTTSSKKADKSTLRTPPTSYTPALTRNHSYSTESVAGTSASTAPSQSLDTLLNSAWPEPPSVKSDTEGGTYNYLSETGAEDDSDQEEYLPSPTSIGGGVSGPASPVEPLPLVPIPLFKPVEDKDWEPDSRVTSYLSASPTIRSPATPRAATRKEVPRPTLAPVQPSSLSLVPPTPTLSTSTVVAPVLKAPLVPKRSTSYQSVSSIAKSSQEPILGSVQRRRLSTNLSRKDPYPVTRDSNHHRHTPSPRNSIGRGPELWTVPRNQRHRPTISFEFPPTSQFWDFLNEYQAFTSGLGKTRDISEDSGYAEMASSRTTSSASGSRVLGHGSPAAAGVGGVDDPVRDWHRTSVASSQGTVERTASPYVPTTDVIQRNELIVNALKNAPGALTTRFRHFGQLGVLGWSSEFSELVDEIQRCGLERQMFTTTREQALATCRDLLRLRMQVSMQMISMFLCSQIARLRRFLDGETVYTDYPTPDFPLPELGNY
ncbi:hypothetical protein RhiJN_25432 [Ceratobasidium sp. AG-Ba]|nr:hypothetical protein RhiJN_25432 [Ceratobasidium sp. AG-Ba]